VDKILVTIFGILAISFVFWFFLGKKEKGMSEMSEEEHMHM